MVLPGGGHAPQQPVHVDDVADAAVTALFETRASRRTYNVSGDHPLTFRALVETAARSIGVRPWTLHAPVDGLATAVGVLERARFPLRLRAEQILRIAEDKAFDHEDAARDFGFRPRSFEEGVVQEARLLQLESEARA